MTTVGGPPKPTAKYSGKIITLQDFRHTVHLLNSTLLAVIARFVYILFYVSFLSATLACVHTRIEPSPFDRWTVFGFVWLGGHRYPFTAYLSLASCIQAAFSSVLATFGYYSPHRLGWMLMVPWLVKMAIMWLVRCFQLAQSYAQAVSQDSHTSHVYAILMLVNVIHILTWGQVGQCMWLRCMRMQNVRLQANKFQRWRYELNKNLKAQPTFTKC